MKKHLLTFSFISLCALSLSAQITVTTADVAVPSKVIYQATDTLPSVSIGTAGTNQTWNMAALQNNKQDTLTFLDYSAAPNSTFSSSNLVARQGYQSNYVYLVNAASGLTNLGMAGIFDFGGGPTPVKQINSPAEIIMNFPATYNTSFTNNHIMTTPPFHLGITYSGIPIDSGRSRSNIKKNVLVDGWGSITTPLGTYNALRSKETVVKHDTTDVYVSLLGGWQNGAQKSADSTTTYTWWANGIGFPLVTATMDSAGAVKNVQWLLSLPATLGITESSSAAGMMVFPDPAQNNLNIFIADKNANLVEVFDITGKKINSYPVQNTVAALNTTAYTNGSFTFLVYGKDNAVINRGKFIIAK